MSTQYHLKTREWTKTPSRTGKVNTKQRQTSKAIERNDGERPSPYLRQRRKRSTTDLNNDLERSIKRRSNRIHRKVERNVFVN